MLSRISHPSFRFALVTWHRSSNKSDRLNRITQTSTETSKTFFSDKVNLEIRRVEEMFLEISDRGRHPTGNCTTLCRTAREITVSGGAESSGLAGACACCSTRAAETVGNINNTFYKISELRATIRLTIICNLRNGSKFWLMEKKFLYGFINNSELWN